MSSVPLPSPASESGSLVFEDGISSDGIPSPNEHIVPVPLALHSSGTPYDGAKGVASAGLSLHSPLPIFVSTPFATGPTPLFEYPFPAPQTIRPSLSNASSLSSISSLHGPPSPSTRLMQHPFTRLASKSTLQQPVRRRFSGGNGIVPPIRVPPRLRTDSSSSVTSSVIDEPTLTAVSAPGPSNTPSSTHPSPLLRLRDRSGSLGVLPIQLPPPIVTSIHPTSQLNRPSRPPVSPALVVSTITSPEFCVTSTSGIRSPLRRSVSHADESDEDECTLSERRRASMPAIFGLREEIDREDELDNTETPTLCKLGGGDESVANKEEHEGIKRDLGMVSLSLGS